MMRVFRVLASLFAVAAGVAPPVAVPPPVQAALPVASVAAQTLGSYVGSGAALMPPASAAAPIATPVGAQQPMLPTQSGMRQSDAMTALRDSPMPSEAIPFSRPVEQYSQAQPAHAAMGSTYSLLKLATVFLLAAASAAAALEWSHGRQASGALERAANALELGTLKEKFAVAAFSGDSAPTKSTRPLEAPPAGKWDPLHLQSESAHEAAGVQHGRVVLLSATAPESAEQGSLARTQSTHLAAAAAVAAATAPGSAQAFVYNGKEYFDVTFGISPLAWFATAFFILFYGATLKNAALKYNKAYGTNTVVDPAPIGGKGVKFVGMEVEQGADDYKSKAKYPGQGLGI